MQKSFKDDFWFAPSVFLVQRCSERTALERQDLTSTYLAHCEMRSVPTVTIIVNIIIIILIVIILILVHCRATGV